MKPTEVFVDVQNFTKSLVLCCVHDHRLSNLSQKVMLHLKVRYFRWPAPSFVTPDYHDVVCTLPFCLVTRWLSWS